MLRPIKPFGFLQHDLKASSVRVSPLLPLLSSTLSDLLSSLPLVQPLPRTNRALSGLQLFVKVMASPPIPLSYSLWIILEPKPLISVADFNMYFPGREKFYLP